MCRSEPDCTDDSNRLRSGRLTVRCAPDVTGRRGRHQQGATQSDCATLVNTFASIVAGWIDAAFKAGPRFRRRHRDDGELEVVIRAPKGSRAGALVVGTWRGDLWIRFAPPHMSYPIDSRAELLSVVRRLMSDRVQLAATYRGDTWRGTTLIGRGQTPSPRRGEVIHVVSWSGRFDAMIEHGKAGIAYPEAARAGRAPSAGRDAPT